MSSVASIAVRWFFFVFFIFLVSKKHKTDEEKQEILAVKNNIIYIYYKAMSEYYLHFISEHNFFEALTFLKLSVLVK